MKSNAFLTIFASMMLLSVPCYSEFLYEGAFRVPKGVFGEETFSNNPYVNAQYQPIAFDESENAIILGQSTQPADQPKRFGKISVPEIIDPASVGFDINALKTASVLHELVDISSGRFDNLLKSGEAPSSEARAQPGGLLVVDSRLVGTMWAYYDASGGNSYRSHFLTDVTWDSGFGFEGLFPVGQSPTGSLANGGFVGGYMTEVPERFQTELGGNIATGRTGGPIVSRSSFGPTLWVFSLSDLDYDKPAPAKMLIGYDSEHKTIGDYSDSSSLLFNRSTGVNGVVWPESSDSVFFFGNHGLGLQFDNSGLPVSNDQQCFGYGTSNRQEAFRASDIDVTRYQSRECGFRTVSSEDVQNNVSCCFDPVNSGKGLHDLGFKVGQGSSCYGYGTRDFTEARQGDWLKKNSPAGYQCGSEFITNTEIQSDIACCFVGTNSTAKGGSSYPSVYQIWEYKVEDILKVNRGELEPWEIIPTAKPFDLPFAPKDRAKQLISTAYDRKGQRLFILQAFGDGLYPLVHVMRFRSDSSSPRPPQDVKLSMR